MRSILIVFILSVAAACGAPPVNNKPNVNKAPAVPQRTALPVYGYEVVKAYPHDQRAFTEGLFFHDGALYESTGEQRRSSIRKVELTTGKVLQKWDLPAEDFGEGIAMIGDKIYMLTWQQGLGRVFNAGDFKLLREFSYQGEGWGMTTDGTNLILSQGTHVLKVMDPNTFETVRTIPVMREDGRPLMRINELEWIKGEIWANVWHSEDPEVLGKPNYIARIDPNSGKLLGWINLAGISPDDQDKPGQEENTLNGIAYDSTGDRIFVTGKNWKKLYEIKIKEPAAQ
ncbi:MAG: glutaminyl-peptide cyclotransferase [Chloracidobacterium sp.]|nr:glutaminyl-peptide cyclotransferase [Chloracidobacterium sp.]